MGNNRRPQAPKRRNFVAKNVNKVHRPQTFRDRTKYNRYEDDLQDRLNDFMDEPDEIDEEIESERKKAFLGKLTGEKYDPDMNEEWEKFRDSQLFETEETWDDYDYDDYDEYDY